MTFRTPPALTGIALTGAMLASVLTPSVAQAAERGVGVFMSECAECHSVAQGKNKRGPTLFGVLDRPSAAAPGYKYSNALRQAHWTWDEATLRRYLSQPSDKALPGTKMEYEGLDPKQLEDVIAYLRTRR
jgi:cytochrome c